MLITFKEYRNLIIITISVFVKAWKKLLIYLIKSFGDLRSIEKVSLFALAGGIVLSMVEWMNYEHNLSDKYTTHGVSTDNYHYYLISFSVIVFSYGLQLMWKSSLIKYSRLIKISQVGILGFLSLLYFSTIIHPESITAAEGAVFTVWFYLFGINLALLLVTGTLGIFMPSIRSEN